MGTSLTNARATPAASFGAGEAPGPLLHIRDLHVDYITARGHLHPVRGVTLDIHRSEVVGLVGESGSGKSTVAYAVVRCLSPNARVARGAILFEGTDLLGLPEADLHRLRGRRIGMVYQDPNTSLNPALPLGEQVVEVFRYHLSASREAAVRATMNLFERVNLPDPVFMMRKFPHEVSGGEKQRVLIAIAFSLGPSLVILDEPTTALDATTAAEILDLIRELQAETGIAALYITHDLGIVAQVAGRLAVIYAGEIVEEGPADAVFTGPRHPYTRMLVASVPNPYRAGERRRLPAFAGAPPDLHAPPAGCIFRFRCPFAQEVCAAEPMVLRGDGPHRDTCIRIDRTLAQPLPQPVRAVRVASPQAEEGALLEVSDLTVHYRRWSLLDQVLRRPAETVFAVDGVSFAIQRGETLGLVGESGCGKSSLARALVGLEPFTGSVALAGRPISHVREMDTEYRRAVQIIFQHPDSSLNPRQTVGAIIGRPLRLYGLASGLAVARRVAEILEQVNLPPAYATRYPHQLSGGEKQRVAIARAFAPRPRLVICDEITSGLDVSVQASIVNLLADLQDEQGTAYLFISHDLNLVRHIADRVAVMYLGRIVELCQAIHLLQPPYHPYTEALLSAVPVPDPGLRARRVRLSGPLPSAKNPPPGCPFHTRCPRKLGPICEVQEPPLVEVRPGHWIACHIGAETLAQVSPIWEPVHDEVRTG
jgi:peptide/nickel transport system ATP-binding protein